MLLDAVGLTLPFAMAIALGPIPIIAAILVVDSAAARSAGWAFALGWTVGIVLLAAVLGLLFGNLGEATQNGPLVNWLKIAVGLLLFWAAAQKLKSWRSTDEVVTPKWLDTFSNIGPVRALRMGVTFAVVNPKHIAFVAAAMSSLSYATTSAAELVASIVVFALLSASTVLAVVMFHAWGGARATTLLEAIKGAMIRHSNIILVVLFVILGANILGAGLAGLNG